MIFVDLIASMSERLSAVRPEESARIASNEPSFDARVGLASIELGDWDGASKCTIDGADLLRQLAAPVIAVVGANAIARTVANFARDALGTEVVVCGPSKQPPKEIADPMRPVVSREAVQMSGVVCFALPWTADAGDWLRWYREGPAPARTIFVAWRRSPPVECALAYLSHHLTEEVRLSALAAHVGLSKSHLLRQFRASLGIAPHRCQLLVRLARAKTMVRRGTDIAEVALALGFFDQSHLDRTFRLLAGTSPSRYRSRQDNVFRDEETRRMLEIRSNRQAAVTRGHYPPR
jgi:AraC-like DNA-binding protein